MESDDELIERLVGVRRWKRGGLVAPHKPLMMLAALARLQAFGDRTVRFVEVEKPLRRLLDLYGNARRSSPSYPFWRLQNDQDIWHVRDSGSFPLRNSGGDPPVSALRAGDAEAGFTEAVLDSLERRPDLLVRVAHALLDEFFPSSLHMDIAAQVGIDLQSDRETYRRRRRCPHFAGEVLEAYEYSCAVCGFDLRVDSQSFALEAAHVRWHCYDGESTLENGLALCGVHHKALDLGVLGIGLDHTIRISKRATGGRPVHAQLHAFSGRELASPVGGAPSVSERNLRWHEKRVFKAPDLDVA